VECDRERILMDCGSGTVRTLARFGRAWQRVTRVLLSHFHTDHVADLAPLLFALKHGLNAPRSAPLTVLGPGGLLDHIEALSHAHGEFLRDPGFPVEFVELSPGDRWSTPGGTCRIETFPTIHTAASLAYKLVTPAGVLGYTGDTGPDPSLGRFLSGCDVLIAECSLPDGSGMSLHLTPSSLGEIAGVAGAGLLVTVHAYPPLDPEKVPDLLRSSGYGGKVLTGKDGLSFTLSSGEVVVER
jgi:ribonuclease BN (tRNA processing enzyme)